MAVDCNQHESNVGQLISGTVASMIEQALKACESSSELEIIPMDPFELERLIGDLCFSINDTSGGKLQGELLDLCDRLEAAEKYGDGMLDEL